MTVSLCIIAERADTHGDFADNAMVAQAIKTAMRGAPNWESLAPWQKESLDLIATKIGRIMSGNPNEADHWADISGYSDLVTNRIAGGSDLLR